MLNSSDCGKCSCCLVCLGSCYCCVWLRTEAQPQLFIIPMQGSILLWWCRLFWGGACLSCWSCATQMHSYVFTMWKGVKALLKHSASRQNWETSIKSGRFVVSVFRWVSATEAGIPCSGIGCAGARSPVSPVPSEFVSSDLCHPGWHGHVCRKGSEMGIHKNFHNRRGFSPLSLRPLHAAHYLVGQ